MNKKLMTLVTSLVFTIGLFAVFSINESPNGYIYQHPYSYYENYSERNVSTLSFDFTERCIPHDQSIDAAVCRSAISSEIQFQISMSGFPAQYYKFFLEVDNEVICSDSLIQWDNTPISFQTSPLLFGDHNLSVCITNTDTLIVIDDVIVFSILQPGTIYRNAYGDELYLKYTPQPANLVKKPVLFVEGFDITSSSGNSEFMNNLVNKWTNQSQTNAPLRYSDVFLLNLGNSTRDVRDNALSVLGALRFIHSLYGDEDLVEGINVFGYSMGGVMARYSLAYAEQWNIPHYCTQYLSLDGPQRGGSINLNMQNLLYELDAWLDDHAAMVSAGGWNPDLVEPYLDKLESDAAKQLLRLNRNAEGVSNDEDLYSIGTLDFLKLFSEINEEERELYNSDRQILNNDPTVSNNKPGFPYKQNMIRSLAFSNGSMKKSGNTSDNDIGLSYYIGYRLVLFGETIASTHEYKEALSCDYDCQPGSVANYFFTSDALRWPDIGFHGDRDLVQNYGPVVVPTKSSLYIKVSNVDNPILPDYTQFNINCFDDIDTDISETELPLLLNSHSYFDELVYPEAAMLPNHDPVWNWRHGELDETYYINAMNQISNWMYDISNRAITEIKGHVADNNISQITAKMYLNGNEYQDFMLDAQGNYCIPYLYTRDADIRLIFEKSGCLPTYRDISLRYADAMLHDYTVPNATMHAFDLNNLTVSNSGSGSFTSINSAMGFVYDYLASGLYNNEPIRIKLLAGTYDESVDLSPLAALGVTNFTLEGIGNPEIKGQITLNCEALSPLQAAGYKIKGIRFSDTALGILFRDSWDDNAEEAHAPHLKLTVENCQFQDCGSPDIQSQSSYGAAAIHFEGAGVINACTFTDNVLTASSSNYATNLKAGAIYVLNNSSDAVTISGCGFANNTGAVSGGLALSGTGAIKVKNNTFEHNLYSGFCATVFQNNRGNALSVFTCGNAEIQNNTFVDNFTSSYGGVVVYLENTSLNPQPLQPILFMNNTIHNNLPGQTGNITSSLSFKYQADPPITQDIIIRNNVFSCPTPTNGARVISVNGYSNPNLSHNILFNTLPEGFSISSDPVHPRFNYTCNPQLGSNLAPLWTQTTMSPCIDAGIGDNDPDGTPPDIGAKRAENHACWQYSFTNQADLEKWYWVSYPVLNRTTDLLKASEFFEELLKKYQIFENGEWHWTPIYLNELDWMEEGESDPRNIIWSTQLDDWSSNQSSHFVSSPQGYKIKLLPRSNPSFPAVVTLKESGFKTSPYLPFPIYGGVENWLGYFKEEPSWPHEVFASIWEDINMIKTKSWCIVRANPLGDYWGMHGKVSTLKYGDMVVVTTNNDHTFQWNNTNIIEDVAVATPVHFTFNEKQDYVPVYISLPDSLKIDLKEIGLYLDGVCKGAVLVENNLEQICAYLDIDEKLTDGVVEFVFYYNPDKSQVQECRTLRIDNSRFAAQYVNGNRRYPFYNITLSPKDLENVTPLEFALNQNYPNPFNPTTTISYQLPESGKVRLDVYNLKGQLVKTLIDGTQVSGLHSIVWNGTDTKNRSVASGVYLYRLSSLDKIQTKRMLLMK